MTGNLIAFINIFAKLAVRSLTFAGTSCMLHVINRA